MSNERDELAHIIWTTSRQDEGTISAAGAESVANALIAAGYQKQQVDTSNEANLAAVIVALDPFERVTKWMATDDEVGRYAVEAVQKIRSILGGGTKVIPAQAVEAALKEWACWPPRTELVTKMLEAAAPHMLAAAWDEGYDHAESDHYGTGFWTKRLRGNPYQRPADAR